MHLTASELYTCTCNYITSIYETCVQNALSTISGLLCHNNIAEINFDSWAPKSPLQKY